MKIILLFFFSLSLCAQTQPEWRRKLLDFAKKNVVHQSWGYDHAERNYRLSLKIAEAEGISLDEEVLFAASYLHDLGGLAGFEVEGVDHGVRSGELAAPLLKGMGFPEEKIKDVQEMIVDHVYTHPTPESPFSRIFREADILDFLGAVGIMRLMAANLEMGPTPDLRNSVAAIESMMKNMPAKLTFPSTKKEGQRRIEVGNKIMKEFKKDFTGNSPDV